MDVQESSGGGKIRPCYDGRLLPGLHHVAGEGLSAISVKQNHHHCKFTSDAKSRRPLVTCNQTIDKRNSFWDLLKPDLRKIKGLECSTSGSVADLFKAHNVENAGKPTYRKKMLRLLGSLVRKKSKTSIGGSDLLLQNRYWSERQSVLAALVQEKEMNSPKIVSLRSDYSSTKLLGSNYVTETISRKNVTVDTDTVDTLFISQPKGANMLCNSSDNAFIEGLQATELLNGEISPYPFTSPLRETSGLDALTAPCISGVPSCLRLENKQPLPYIGTDNERKSQCHELDYKADDKTCENEGDELLLATKEFEGTENKDITTNYVMNEIDGIDQGENLPSTRTSAVMKKWVNEMLEEMQQMENYISSYTSSFCVQEEEFTNYQVLEKKTSEVIRHFFDEIRTSAKLEKAQSSDPEFIINNDERYKGVFCSRTDSGIDFGKLDIQNKNYPSFNLITFNEDNTDNSRKNDSSTEMGTVCNDLDSNNLIEFEDIFSNGNTTQDSKPLKFDNNVLGGHELITNEAPYKETCSNKYWNEIKYSFNEQQSGVSEFNDTFDKNNLNVTSGYCIWEESEVGNTGLCTGVPQNYSDTRGNTVFGDTGNALIPCSLLEEVWKEYYEAIQSGAFFSQADQYERSYDPGYEYVTRLYSNKVYKEAEHLVNSIEDFIVNECAPVTERQRSYYNPCTITEIEDYVIPRTDYTEVNIYDSKWLLQSSSYADTMIADEVDESKNFPQEVELETDTSQYDSQNKYKRNLRPHGYLHDNSGDVDVEILEEKSSPPRETKTPDYIQSRLVQAPENIHSANKEHFQMIFTSPNVQINLTNPIVNKDKK